MNNPMEEAQYWFKKMDRFQMSALVDKEHPISLINFESLINRVADRYPSLPKTKIVQIVQTTFETMRSMLIVGHHLAIDGLVSRMKMHFVRRFRGVGARVATSMAKDVRKDIQ
jgi:hypothetical protein